MQFSAQSGQNDFQSLVAIRRLFLHFNYSNLRYGGVSRTPVSDVEDLEDPGNGTESHAQVEAVEENRVALCCITNVTTYGPNYEAYVSGNGHKETVA